MSKSYRKRSIGEHNLSPDSLALSYGFDPYMSEGAVKPPIFMTSTFVFKSAADGEALFKRLRGENTELGIEYDDLIYTRFNNPSMEVLEDRLTLYDRGEGALAFSSGMAAITTSLITCAKPGSTILHTTPLYGAAEVFIRNFMPSIGVRAFEVDATASEDEIFAKAQKAMAGGPLSVIYTESPANPTNALVDIAAVKRVRDKCFEQTGSRPILMCDNTMTGPIGHQPIRFGADLVLYSLTKYIGGHSDLIAGAAIGADTKIVDEVRKTRNFLGSTLDPHACWLLTRSLETVKLRMDKAFENAKQCADYLNCSDKVSSVLYPGFLKEGDPQKTIFDEQFSSAGSTFSFVLVGGKSAAFRLLDNLQLIKLAVSLGGTESLMCHPSTTTHSGVARDVRERMGISDGLVRFSVGIENIEDLIADLRQAMDKV